MNKALFRGVWGGVLMAAAAVFVGGSARAGQVSPSFASCTFEADGSGSCSGTLKAFRDSPDASASLVLNTYADSYGAYRYAYVSYQSQSQYIWLNSGAAMQAAFDRAATAVDAQLFLHWNTNQELDFIQLWNASYQQ